MTALPIGLAIASLLLLGFLCQWLAWRVRLPAILFLLLSGIVLGPLTGWFDPDAALGPLLFPSISLGVAVILFEGSLTLRLAEIRGVGSAILSLVSLGTAITVAGLAAVAHYLVGLEWPLALLFGALCCVTGPTVIVPMLRSVRPNPKVANVLRWEGIIIDPIGALLAVLVFEAVALGHGEDGVWIFAWTVALGSAVGLAAAYALAYLLRRHHIPEYLQNYATLALLLVAFSASNTLAEESGLLAVTVMGIMLANIKGIDVEDILDFKGQLSTLLISMLFIILAARLEWPTPWLLLAGLMVLATAMLVIRPLAVVLSTLGSGLNWRERALLAWIAPRGIVAASVSALFALKLEARGVENADWLVALTFILIIGTVVIQSATSRRLARWLKVSAPDSTGVLIVGANPVALALAQALQKQGFEPLLADPDTYGIRAARMAGLKTFLGSPVSEHADRRIDLLTIGHLLALSTSAELNTLACVRYQSEFGKDRVHRLRVYGPEEAPKRDLAKPLKAPALFGADITHAEFDARLDAGWTIKTTKLSDSFGWTDFAGRYAEAPLPLFGITERGLLRFAHEHLPLEPGPGWKVAALVKAAPADAAEDTGQSSDPAGD